MSRISLKEKAAPIISASDIVESVPRANGKGQRGRRLTPPASASDVAALKQAAEARLQAVALQKAIFDSASFSSIATDAKGVIQIFNVGAERMMGYTAAEVISKLTPADLHESQEVIARAEALT